MPAYQVPSDLAGTYWGQLTQATPGLGDEGRITHAGRQPQIANGYYLGGATPPAAGQLTPGMQALIYSSGGTSDHLTPKQASELQAQGWAYGKPAPKGYTYDSSGVLVHKESLAHQIGGVALTDAALLTTGLTAGATSPWLAATLGGATAATATKLQGGTWKQALIAGGLGAASAGLGASHLAPATKIPGQVAVGAANGAANGGGLRGAVLGAATSAGTAAATPQGGGTVATPTTAPATPSLQTYLLQAAIGAGTGAAAGGGLTGAVLGAGVGAAGAAGGRTTAQAAAGAGSTLASKILSGAAAAGNAAGNAAAAREAGRATETGNILTQDQQRLAASTAHENAQQGRASTEIAQHTEGRAADNNAYRNALLSALAMHTQDVSANRPAGVPNITFSGGARPSAIGPEGRAAGAVMNHRAMDQLEHPASLMELPPLESFSPSALPKPSGVDTALGIGGTIGNLITGYQQGQQADQRSSLIAALLAQSQQQAAQGLDNPTVAPKPKTLQDEIDAVNRRVSGVSA